MDSYGFHFHKHFFPNHSLLVVGCKEIGIKEDSKNHNGVLEIFSNDYGTHAWYIKKHVCNHTAALFPLATVYLNN